MFVRDACVSVSIGLGSRSWAWEGFKSELWAWHGDGWEPYPWALLWALEVPLQPETPYNPVFCRTFRVVLLLVISTLYFLVKAVTDETMVSLSLVAPLS
jgi:hypothetical protein